MSTTPARRIAIWTGAALALALVASAYLNPQLMLDLADQLWACF